MSWAGTTIRDGIPVCGRRVHPKNSIDSDESFYWNYDEDIYFDLS
jgi:hypothetical protein